MRIPQKTTIALCCVLCSSWIRRCSGNSDAPDSTVVDQDAGLDTRPVLSWPDLISEPPGPDIRLDIVGDSRRSDSIHDARPADLSPGDLLQDGQQPAAPGLICDPASPGLCSNSADCLLLETSAEQAVITAKSTACTMGCLGNNDPAACALQCMSNPFTGAGISSPCAECYLSNEMCILTNCVAHCVPDPHAENCLRCQDNEPVTPPNTNGVDCNGEFSSCSGLYAARCAFSKIGACTSVSDCTSLVTKLQLEAVKSRVTACTLGCLIRKDPRQCILDCTNAPTTGTGLSAPCNGCYGDETLCMFVNCIAHCLPDSTTAKCISCLNNEPLTPPNTSGVDCLGEFTDCSGLSWR